MQKLVKLCLTSTKTTELLGDPRLTSETVCKKMLYFCDKMTKTEIMMLVMRGYLLEDNPILSAFCKYAKGQLMSIHIVLYFFK